MSVSLLQQLSLTFELFSPLFYCLRCHRTFLPAAVRLYNQPPIDLTCPLCHKMTYFSVFCTNWKISHTHMYYYSTTHCHTAYNYTVKSLKPYVYTLYMSVFLFLNFYCIVYTFNIIIV